MTKMKLSERLRQTYMGIELIIRWADEVAQLEAEVEKYQEAWAKLKRWAKNKAEHEAEGGDPEYEAWLAKERREIEEMFAALEAGGE
jgi:hypothetical protein